MYGLIAPNKSFSNHNVYAMLTLALFGVQRAQIFLRVPHFLLHRGLVSLGISNCSDVPSGMSVTCSRCW